MESASSFFPDHGTQSSRLRHDCQNHLGCPAHGEGRTQKSISRFPLPPNSLSPTWNETVILSSRCSSSWKHSRECDLSWMVCAAVAVIHPSRVTSRVVAESRIVKVAKSKLFPRVSDARRMSETEGEWALLTGGLISDNAKGVLSRNCTCTDHINAVGHLTGFFFPTTYSYFNCLALAGCLLAAYVIA